MVWVLCNQTLDFIEILRFSVHPLTLPLWVNGGATPLPHYVGWGWKLVFSKTSVGT